MSPKHNLQYPTGPQNTLNRYNDRGSYDLEKVHTIVNSTSVLHVSFQPDPSDPFPAILPMIGHMGSFARPSSSISDPLDCYLHGYVSSRIMNVARAAVDSGKPGVPVCIAASKVDGLVLSLTPNSHSYNYRSAVLFGYATPVTDVEEKEWAMEMITNSVVPQRYENSRIPPIPAEMQSTTILRVTIDSASSKVRDWIPSDSAEDMANQEVVEKVWVGVVPVYETYGEPIPSPLNKVEKVPEYVQEFVKESNEESFGYAIAASKKPVPVKTKRDHDENTAMMTKLLPGQVKRVAIIGAGPSGLAAAKYLTAEKSISQVTIYEQRPTPGGVWNATPSLTSLSYSIPQTTPDTTPPVPLKGDGKDGQEGSWDFQSAVYDYLEANIPKPLMNYTDLKFQDETPLFPGHGAVNEYLDAYADDVRKHIRFGTQVLDIQRHGHELKDGDKSTTWHVKSKVVGTDEEETAVFDSVVVANGHYDCAFIPNIKGVQDWNHAYPGSIIHSKNYKRPENYDGKKVIVVGAGVSGIDIANQVAPHAHQPLLLSRRAAKGSSSPLAPEKTSIEDVSEIEEFIADDRTVRFIDGRIESGVDDVIFCTGYLYSYPFLQNLKPAVVTTGYRTENLYLHLFYNPEPTLSFLGLPIRIVPFIIAEVQSALVARFLAGRIALPSLSERTEWEDQLLQEKGPGKAFHFMGFPEDAQYIDELVSMVEKSDGEGDGLGKTTQRWDKKSLWIRENSGKIVAAVRGLEPEAREKIKTLEDAGFSYEGDTELEGHVDN
ncbi:hypothetical protein V494_06753 [Pseudogymnoascus sp. VKM F-4513 (FW-928)]|nr:hypothetical protein V494_06753 [Pseudogymnoascus sp. VKM F-4513 (FW-928)]